MMRFFKLAFKGEIAVPILALVLASGATLAIGLVRIAWTGRSHEWGLAWNLFLAWLPLLFALLASDEFRRQPSRKWRSVGFTAAWLLFFPNAPYIFTDLVHVTGRFHGPYWVDLILILLCAVTGLVLGFLSLFLMQEVVARRLGRLASWIFIAGVAGLSGLGIYLGRFLRFNSWDIVFKPFALGHSLVQLAADPFSQPHSPAFPVLFAAFLFISYVMLYALTHLQPTPRLAVPAEA